MVFKKFPPQIKYIVGNEAAERFSYYGMRSILTIFMVSYLLMPEAEAKSTYHLFIAACYLLPLIGAYVSDRFLGKYKTILYLSIVYCFGHLVLAIWENQTGLYFGLGLIAIGSGGIKPCVSAHVGDQFNKSNQHMLSKVFDLFYWAINFGSFFSTLLIPFLRVKFGPGVAFGVPGILMAIATFVFWLGRNKYVHVPPTGKNGPAGFVPVFAYSLLRLGDYFKLKKTKKMESFIDMAKDKFTPSEVDGTKAAYAIFILYATVSVFWALFDQQGSTWTLQARAMDLHFMGMDMAPDQIQALNPIMVMALIPIFSFWIYPGIEKLGIKVTPLRKMSAGMVIAGISFAIVAVFQTFLDSGMKLNAMWQFIPYLVITMAEVMVSITGLEFAYTQAPRAMKSTIMSFWLLTVFVGNFLAAGIASMSGLSGATEFWFYAGLMIFVSLIFMFSATRYKTRNYVEPA